MERQFDLVVVGTGGHALRDSLLTTILDELVRPPTDLAIWAIPAGGAAGHAGADATSEEESTMSALMDLSDGLARAVERAAKAVVLVNGRPDLGSTGVHWQPGLIVTADHTLAAEDDITIETPDGRIVPARVAGRDAISDLAILRADAAGLPVADIGDSAALRVGHVVLAVGYGPRVKLGVVSALGGRRRGRETVDLVRLDLTLYPGFSGGPLVDAEGRVVGINTSGLSRALRCAIPASTVTRVLDEIVARGRVSRGYLGVGLQPVRLPDAARSAAPSAGEVGLMVVSIQPDGPAARAGLLLGDVLVALDGETLREPGDVQAAVASRPAGATVVATVLRAGSTAQVTVTVGERPAPAR